MQHHSQTDHAAFLAADLDDRLGCCSDTDGGLPQHGRLFRSSLLLGSHRVGYVKSPAPVSIYRETHGNRSVSRRRLLFLHVVQKKRTTIPNLAVLQRRVPCWSFRWHFGLGKPKRLPTLTQLTGVGNWPYARHRLDQQLAMDLYSCKGYGINHSSH